MTLYTLDTRHEYRVIRTKMTREKIKKLIKDGNKLKIQTAIFYYWQLDKIEVKKPYKDD